MGGRVAVPKDGGRHNPWDCRIRSEPGQRGMREARAKAVAHSWPGKLRTVSWPAWVDSCHHQDSQWESKKSAEASEPEEGRVTQRLTIHPWLQRRRKDQKWGALRSWKMQVNPDCPWSLQNEGSLAEHHGCGSVETYIGLNHNSDALKV